MTCLADFKRLHRARVPKMFYDYAESGSWTEHTFRRNAAALDEITLRQRVAVDISERSVRGRMLGQDWRLPLAIAPTGLTGMQHADGEIVAAQAAEAFGIPFTLSTMSICSIEDVAAHTSAPFWFQLYVMRDREFIAALIERAKVSGCSALVLTLDLQILGQRHKDVKNRMTAPPQLTLKNLLNMATKPRWCAGMLGTRRYNFGNVVGHAKGVSDLASLGAWSAQQLDPTLNWDDVAWVKEQWGGPLILKGILDVADVPPALEAGADAIVVSNHGGRQLDGAPASIEVLSEIARMVDGRAQVWMDGGIRSGQDILKARALGADAVMTGKAFLNALGAFGGAGVTKLLEIFAKELDLTMAFCGHTDIDSVDASIIYHRNTHHAQQEAL